MFTRALPGAAVLAFGLKLLSASAFLVILGVSGAASAEPREERWPVTRAQLNEIVAWLSSNFDLPATEEYPHVELAPAQKIVAMRYKGMLSHASRQDSIRDPASQTAGLREVVAIYRDDTRTIYLNDRWTGASPAEMSVLVHEMVHHLQNVGGLKYECAAAREKPAYLAQNDWLKRFGTDLEAEFDIDGMTLLVTTGCMY